MTIYIDGNIPGSGGTSLPSATIEAISNLGGDIDILSSNGAITIVGDDSANTIDFTISDATAALKGLATAAQITKLDGIEALAEVNIVDSVFSRTGAVAATSGDYVASQVNNDSGVSGSSVKDALDALTTHKDDHKSGGSDAFVSTDLLEAAVKRIQTTTGPTILTVGAIAETEALVRIGSTLVGSPRVAENLFIKARNESGSVIAVNKLVAPVGFDAGTNRILVDLADKDDATKRPAVGMTTEAIADDGNTDLLLSVGTLVGIDTSLLSVNDQLVLGTAGDISRPPPDVDPFTGEIQLIGQVTRVDASSGQVFVTLSAGLLPATAAQFFATKEITPSGSISGGEVSRTSGLNVDVAGGTGYINDGTDLFRVTWAAATDLLLADGDTNFIFVDSAGVVQTSVSMPSLDTNILLADAITNGTSSVILLANHNVLLEQRSPKSHIYAEDVIGNVAVSGLTTTKATSAYRLKVDAGTFYTHDFKVSVPATNPITFTYWFLDGSGGWTHVLDSTLIDKDNWDDGTGTLNSLVAGEWKKDLLFIVSTGVGLVEYHVFYGQEVFASQGLAEGGLLPSAASDVISNAVRSGGIVIEGASAAITSIVDVRPFIGQLAPGTTAVSDHGLLSGLSDDDHPIYLPTNGSRAMAGTLDMGANPISNVGNVDGVDVSSHQTRHAAAGADELPVDTLAESTSASNDISRALRPDGAGGVEFLDVAHAHLTGVTSDQHHAKLHAGDHVNGTDDVQDATAGQKGLATAAQITKLDSIATSAEVNVVDSVFGRTAAVVATSGDYDASLINNDSGVVGSSVDDALDNLDADIPTRVSTFGSAFTSPSTSASGGTQSFNITGFGKRGTNIQRLQITPSTDIDDYTVELFREDTFATQQYDLANVTTSASSAVVELDEGIGLMWDDDDTSELHMKITNDDPANAATFDVEVEGVTIPR